MKKIKYFTTLTLSLALLLSVASPSYALSKFTGRILIENDSYKLAKYEPTSGVYLGAYVIQDTLINGDAKTFNELTKKKHASFFRYVGYGQAAPVSWINEMKQIGAAPHIAFEPNDGLAEVKDNEYLREFARELGQAQVPIFLRFASEMNGNWAAYSGNPDKYIEKWKLVHDVMKEEAPNVMMTWTVFTFPQNTITKYYPGDAYVDWVGVNIYNVVYHNNNINLRGDHEDPLELLDYVYDTFSDRKPIQISEFGVTHYTVTDDSDHIDFAKQKLTRMYTGLKAKYPRVKSIFYFDVNNLINAPEGRKINNYAVTDHPGILKTYSNLVSDDHYLSEMGPNLEGTNNPELFNIKDTVYIENGITYITYPTVQKYFGVNITLEKHIKNVVLRKGETTFNLPYANNPGQNAVFYKDGRHYFPLRELTTRLDYKTGYDEANRLIKITKKY